MSDLTPFDTGELYEPKPWPPQLGVEGAETGNVDFDDSESATVLTVVAYPSSVDAFTDVIEITHHDDARALEIVVGTRTIRINPEGVIDEK